MDWPRPFVQPFTLNPCIPSKSLQGLRNPEKIRGCRNFLLQKYDIRVLWASANSKMPSHQKTETLEVMIPSSQTAALGRMANQGEINTASRPASILYAVIDAHPDLKKTQGGTNVMILSATNGNQRKDSRRTQRFPLQVHQALPPPQYGRLGSLHSPTSLPVTTTKLEKTVKFKAPSCFTKPFKRSQVSRCHKSQPFWCHLSLRYGST